MLIGYALLQNICGCVVMLCRIECNKGIDFLFLLLSFRFSVALGTVLLNISTSVEALAMVMMKREDARHLIKFSQKLWERNLQLFDHRFAICY